MMLERISLCVMFTAAFLCCSATVADCDEPYVKPEVLQVCLWEREDLEPSYHLNPAYLRGDFNGDGWADYAIHVREIKESGNPAAELKILFCWGGKKGWEVLGPDDLLGRLSKWSFSNDGWAVWGKGAEELFAFDSPGVGEVIYVTKEEKPGGLIYWKDGSWYYHYLED